MNVLQVNYTDLPGRRFNGYDLLADLRARGIGGAQAVLSKVSDDPNVVSLWDDAQDGHLQGALLHAEARYGMDDLLFPWGRVLARSPAFLAADVVHYHLLHARMISLLDLPWLFSLRPSVWTLHDAWALTGHCIQPGDCRRWLKACEGCPSPDADVPLPADKAHQMWRVKQRMFAAAGMDLVVASQSMFDMVRLSPIAGQLPRVHLIPFGIDVTTFRHDLDRSAARRHLGIGDDEFVLFFRAVPSPNKGLRFIREALLASPPARATTLLTVDRRGLLADLTSDYHVIDMGWVEDTELYPRLFAACDVFLMPSTGEAFGLMALEAMASARPVICFEGTALPGVTHAPECGLAVPSGDTAALRDAIDGLMLDPSEVARRGEIGRTIAVEEFSHERYVDSLVSLYETVASRRRAPRA